MKTPREILLEHHRAAEPQLHAVRKHALAKLTAARRAPEPLGAPASLPASSENRDLASRDAGAPRIGWLRAKAWAQLTSSLLSLRWHLAALSAAWLAILLLNIDRTAAPLPVTAKQSI